MYSWADVIGYDAFLECIDDQPLRAETRGKTVEMFRLVDRGGCRHQAIVRHLDETIPPCGTSCDVCRGAGIETLVADAATASRRASLDPVAGARAAGSFAAAFDDTPVDPERFDRLRALRKRLADAEGVPAYIVFSDAVLRQMAARVPRTREEMLALSGVGPVKLDRYGKAFLEALRAG